MAHSPLPAGFVLDQQPQAASLPPGFVLDAQPQEQLKQERNELGRQAGLTARHVIEGAAGLAGIVADPIGTTLGAVTGQTYQPLQQYVSGGLDRLGLPQPETSTERVVGGASRALVGGGGFVGGGQALARQTPNALRAAGEFLSVAPGTQAAATVAGTSAAEIARESGASPATQTLVGLGTGLAVPAGFAAAQAGVRGAYRGGEAGRQRVEENVRRFNAVGTNPTVGQATEGRLARSAENLLARVPGGSGVILKRAEQQADEIGAGVESAASRLTPSSSAERAGMAIQRGVRGEGGFVDQFKATQTRLWNELDRHVAKDSPVDMTNTANALAALNADIRGAPALSEFFKNKTIQAIEAAMKSDTGEWTRRLPYEAMKKLRTLVGQEIENTNLASSVPRSKWKALYAALSEDLGEAVKGNRQAEAAWNRANSYTRAGMRRLDVIDDAVSRNGGPEAVFKAVVSGTKEGATVLRSVMQSLPQDGQKQVAATVVRRLGRANPSNQDEVGGVFSTERFLTNWNNISPEAKVVLFNRFGPRFRHDMDRIAQVAANLRSGSRVYANPSGTGQAVAQASTVTAAVLSFLTGQWGALGAIGGSVGAANLAARLMVKPEFVSWLARATRLPASALNSQILILDNIAKRVGDEELVQFAVALKESSQGQRSQQTQPR